MDQIAEVAELSKGSLYLYFPRKEDLYITIVLEGLEITLDGFAAADSMPRNGARHRWNTRDFFRSALSFGTLLLHSRFHIRTLLSARIQHDPRTNGD